MDLFNDLWGQMHRAPLLWAPFYCIYIYFNWKTTTVNTTKPGYSANNYYNSVADLKKMYFSINYFSQYFSSVFPSCIFWKFFHSDLQTNKHIWIILRYFLWNHQRMYFSYKNIKHIYRRQSFCNWSETVFDVYKFFLANSRMLGRPFKTEP